MAAIEAIGDLSQLASTLRADVVAGDPSGTALAGAAGTQATGGVDFGTVLGNGLSQVEQLDKTATTKAVQAATGDLTDVHDYVIAATEAQTAVELTTTIRNKALDAFTEILRMPL